MKNTIISLFMLSLATPLTAQSIDPQKEVLTPIRLIPLAKTILRQLSF